MVQSKQGDQKWIFLGNLFCKLAFFEAIWVFFINAVILKVGHPSPLGKSPVGEFAILTHSVLALAGCNRYSNH